MKMHFTKKKILLDKFFKYIKRILMHLFLDDLMSKYVMKFVELEPYEKA